MRILSLKAEGIALSSIHASMSRTFQSQGVQIQDLAVPQRPDQLQSLKEIAWKGFDCVFLLDLGVSSYFILNIKDLQQSIRIPWIIWFVDDPFGYNFPEACQPDFTLPFCWDWEIIKQSSRSAWKGIPMSYLPLATDPTLFYPGQENSDPAFPGGVFVGSTAHSNELLSKAGETPEFRADVEKIWEIYRKDFRQKLHTLTWFHLSRKVDRPLQMIEGDPICRLWIQTALYWVGIRKRRELVCQIIREGGGVFGDEGWRELLEGGFYQGKIPYGNELREVYNQSTFILDVRQPQSRTGLTQRIFDAGACGRAMLTEWSPEIEALFDPQEELLCFHDEEGARAAKKVCLQDPRGTSQRGEKARQRVLNNHTYRHRAQQILRTFHHYFR